MAKLTTPDKGYILTLRDGKKSEEMEYPDYQVNCPMCGKETGWRDPREYGEVVECINCGLEVELSKKKSGGTC